MVFCQLRVTGGNAEPHTKSLWPPPRRTAGQRGGAMFADPVTRFTLPTVTPSPPRAHFPLALCRTFPGSENTGPPCPVVRQTAQPPSRQSRCVAYPGAPNPSQPGHNGERPAEFAPLRPQMWLAYPADERDTESHRVCGTRAPQKDHRADGGRPSRPSCPLVILILLQLSKLSAGIRRLFTVALASAIKCLELGIHFFHFCNG